MALWKIFLVVVVAVLFSAILIRYWRGIIEILNILMLFLLLVIVLSVKVVIDVIFFPIKLLAKILGYNSVEEIKVKIVKQYDNIFYRADSKKKVAKSIRFIDLAEKVLKEDKRQREEQETKKMLKECKWVL